MGLGKGYAESKVKNLQRDFRDLIAPVAVVAVDSQNCVELWGPAAEKILGWSSGEMLGNQFPVALSDGDPEIRWLQPDSGQWLDLSVRTLPLKGGRLIIVQDLAALRALFAEKLAIQEEITQAIIREQIRFQELLEAAPDAIIEVDQEGRIVLLNRVTEQLFGYTREELLNRPVETLIPEDLRHAHHSHRAHYRTQPTTRPMGAGLTLEAQRKNGSKFPVEISLSPVNHENGFRVSAIIRDVSDRKRAEDQLHAVQAAYTDELAAKNQELAARNELVERADHLKSEFLSGMSHELRSPLHTIIGFAELLREELEGPLNEKQHRFVQHILRDSEHLLALINDVLDLSKIEAGRLELQRDFVQLRAVIDDAVSSVRPRAEAKQLQLEITASVDVEVYADRLRIKQVLLNLLSNAVKFTPNGGSVRVNLLDGDGHAEVSVTDTGVGIPPDKHESIFDKFYQVGQKQAGGQEGTGLGLAITRRLIEEHGGSIVLESEVGKGTRFTVSIPKQ